MRCGARNVRPSNRRTSAISRPPGARIPTPVSVLRSAKRGRALSLAIGHEPAFPMQLLLTLEPVERLEHAEVGAGNHRRESSQGHRPLSSRHPSQGASAVADPQQPPAHWGGTEPVARAGPRRQRRRRSCGRARARRAARDAAMDAPRAAPGPRVHRPAAPRRADGLPRLRRPGGRPDRVGHRARRRRHGVPDVPRARGRAGARRRPGAVPPVPPGDLARRPVRPARHPVRSDLHPDRDPDRARASATRWASSSTGATRVLDRLLRRRRDERGRLPRGGEPRGRLRSAGRCSSARTTAGRSACRPRQQTAGEIWRRAEGYGIPGCGSTGTTCSRCTRRRARRSTGRARGDGPTLIEAMTYRIGAHSTADDARRYRDDPEVEAARAFDPIARFRTWLRRRRPRRRGVPRRVRRGGASGSR